MKKQITLNMKKTLLSLFVILGFASLCSAQITIFEDFDSYQVGEDIVDVNPTFFEYWPGGNLGLEISDAQAASGNNSVYLFSDSGGGPADVIMNFQDKYETGTASLSFQMYVSPGFGAYYNIQAEEDAGVTWASQVFFNSNGTVEFQNSNNTIAASATYTQGEWFEVRYDVNLTENIWELSLGGRCLASYSNPANSFASFNLFPVAQGSDAEFWFDDMRFEHSPVAQEVNRDVALIKGVAPLGGLEGGVVENVAALLNRVGETINEAVLTVEYQGLNQEIVLENLDVAEGDTLQIFADPPILIQGGVNEIIVSIVSINGEMGDDAGCNDNLFDVINAIVPAPRKAVLVEEATGTWCTWCPRGAVFMEFMAEKYGSAFVGIAVHNNDPMLVTDYDTGLTSTPGFTGFPAVVMERSMFMDPSEVEIPFLDRVVTPARGAFEIGADLDAATGNIDISVELEALEEVTVFDNIVLAILEDEVTGTGNGYAQVNAYAGGGNGVMGGYELLPSPVPAEDMVYEDVARALITPYEGVDSEIAGILQPGNTKLLNFNFTLEEEWNTDHLSLVAILLNNDGSANNAYEISLADALDNGFIISNVNDPDLQSSFEIYPNPAADLLNIKLESSEIGDVQLELINIYGQTMQTERLQSFTGQQNWVINISDLPNGVYSARVRIGNKTAIQTVQKFAH